MKVLARVRVIYSGNSLFYCHLSIIFAVAKKNGNLLVKMLKSINFAANDFRTNKKKNTPYLALTSSSVWQKSQRLL